ncbi:hypothetical protein ACFOHS_07755 [Jhaorihella thermophila]
MTVLWILLIAAVGGAGLYPAGALRPRALAYAPGVHREPQHGGWRCAHCRNRPRRAGPAGPDRAGNAADKRACRFGRRGG